MQFGNGVVTELGTLPYNNLAHILEVAKENGHDLGSLLADAEASGEYQPGETTDLHSHQYYGLLEKILNTIDIPAFGVRVGKKFSLADYGVLGYACISSPTLRHFLLTFFRFQQLVGSSASFSESLREEGGNGIIEIQSSAINSQLKRFEIEEAIGQWCTAAETIWQQKEAMFTCINLSVPKPEYANQMQGLLGCPVFYDQACDEMVFPASLLAEPLAMANELTAKLCEQQCDAILQNLTRETGLIEQVRKLIIGQPSKVTTPEYIASQLNISYRTLRRRLSEEGTSFKEIHNDVRMGLAGEYMRQTTLTTQEIGYLLGFSESSNFHRAFKNWYGKTPGDYRETGANES